MPPLLPEVVWGWSKTLPDHVAYFGQARQGLYTLVKHLLQQRASRVFVVPAYTCFSVPQAIEQAGGTCVYVDVDKTLDFDLSDLAEQLKPVDPCDVVLLATSLFGAPVRDYKHMLPSAVVIEDRSQSVYDPGRRSDFQILSFGPGKLLSLGGGGAVVGRDPLKWNMDHWPYQSAWRVPLLCLRTLIQDQVFRHRVSYRLLSPLLSRLLEHSGHHSDPIQPVLMHPWQARWAWYAMQHVRLNKRIEVGQAWMSALSGHLSLGWQEGIPWLRLPVQITTPIEGMMSGAMYKETVDRAQTVRQRVLSGSQRLVNCSFLPVHGEVNPEWIGVTAKRLANGGV